MFSIIVFSERCELKKVTVQSENIKVIKRDRTYATVRELWEKSTDCLEDWRIEEIYESLKRLTNVDEAVKTAHVEDIERRFKNPPTTPVQAVRNEDTETYVRPVPTEPVDTEELVCPRCGSKLVLRKATKGANAGNQFYGCSGFPKCRYIKNL